MMNLSPIKKILFHRTQQRLITELRITLQANDKKGLFMSTPIAEYAIRLSNSNKVGNIFAEVYNSNLDSVEFNEEEESEMKNWVRTIGAQFVKEWISGDLLK